MQVLPKKLHALWLQGEDNAPDIVQACLKTWRDHNPGWSLDVCTKEQALEKLSPVDLEIAKKMKPAAFSDLYRLTVLKEHGGVWIDATTVCRLPLEGWIPDVLRSGFFVFDRPDADRPISSWFMVAAVDHPMICKLQDLTRWVWRQDHVTGVDKAHRAQKYALTADEFPWRQEKFWLEQETLPYFWIHYLFDYMIYTDAEAHDIWQETTKFTAKIPQSLARRALLTPETPEEDLAAALRTLPAPIIKLNWRKHNFEKIPGLRALFR